MTQHPPDHPAPERAPRDVQTLGYEEARAELVDVVRRLEAGTSSLEESLALWERGEALADRCEQVLDGARARVEARVRRERDDDPDTSGDGPADLGGDDADGGRGNG